MMVIDFSEYIIGSYWYSYLHPEVVYMVVYADNKGIVFKNVKTKELKAVIEDKNLFTFIKTQDPSILKPPSPPPLSSCTRDYLLSLVLDRWWDNSIRTRTKREIRNILDFYSL